MPAIWFLTTIRKNIMKQCCSKAPYYICKEDNIVTKCASKTCKKVVCPDHSDCLNFFSPIDSHFFVVLCDDCCPIICEKVTKLFANLKKLSESGLPKIFITKKVIDLLSTLLTSDFLLLNTLVNSTVKECANKAMSYQISIMEKGQHLH